MMESSDVIANENLEMMNTNMDVDLQSFLDDIFPHPSIADMEVTDQEMLKAAEDYEMS